MYWLCLQAFKVAPEVPDQELASFVQKLARFEQGLAGREQKLASMEQRLAEMRQVASRQRPALAGGFSQLPSPGVYKQMIRYKPRPGCSLL